MSSLAWAQKGDPQKAHLMVANRPIEMEALGDAKPE